MRIRIAHETVYAYAKPAAHMIQLLRLTPRSHDGQFVCRWRIDIDADCPVLADEDAYGNVTHAFSIDGPIGHLRVVAEGEVEVEDKVGYVRGGVERLPPQFYLRDTGPTAPDAAIRTFADDVAQGEGGDRLATLHALMRALHADMRFDVEATTASTTAPEAFAARHGVCRDFAQVFIAAARHLEIPARYASGYMLRDDEAVTQPAGHAWAEAHVPGHGWIAFDPANERCATDHYVRVAVGLDAADAAPVRGVQTGGDGELLSVRVTVEPATRQVRPLPAKRGPAWWLAPGQTQSQSQA